jgi:cytochrome c2
MRVRLVTFLAVTLLLIGCTSPHQLPEAPTPIPRLAPATLPADQSSPAATEPTMAPAGGGGDSLRGQQVFEANCSVCHNLTDQPKVGPGLGGLFANQPSLPNGRPFNEANLREWIHNGGGAMPGIPLGEGETDDLIAFLRQETQ